MPERTTAELAQQLAAATDPAALIRMTAAQLAELAGPTPTPAAANALRLTRDYPGTILYPAVAALRPDLLAQPATPTTTGNVVTLQPQPADHGQALAQLPPAAAETTAEPPPAPAPLANLDSLAE